MSEKIVSLNPPQLQVLSWVRDGCPDGVYNDWSHRISARTLHNRGLVVIKGRGASWSATITDSGVHYLDRRTNQSDNLRPTEISNEESIDSSAAIPLTPPPLLRAAHNPRKSIEPKPKMPGPMDQMMAALHEADDHRILLASAEESRYRQLAGAAKRFGRIPDGMRITVVWAGNGQYAVTLEQLPAWQTKTLEPLHVPQHLHNPSSVVVALTDSETFQVTGEPRERALRLAEAVVTHARERGVVTKALLNQPVNRDSYRRDSSRHDEIELRIGQDHFRLWFTQATLQQPHQPTQRDISRVKHGHLFPDFDDVPDKKLGLVLDGNGGQFWASAWKDTEDHRLEDDLAQILEEIRLRNRQLVEQRRAEQERLDARQKRRENDQARAVVQYRKHFLLETMKKQAERWERAILLRRYADAVRAETASLEGAELEQALSWAMQIEAQAAMCDPLPDAARVPEIPEPSRSDIEKFM